MIIIYLRLVEGTSVLIVIKLATLACKFKEIILV